MISVLIESHAFWKKAIAYPSELGALLGAQDFKVVRISDFSKSDSRPSFSSIDDRITPKLWCGSP